MNLIERYNQQVIAGNVLESPEQLIILKKLQEISDALVIEQEKRQRFLSFLHKPQVVKGMYLWGTVGIGKTFMMDSFYEGLPLENKMRMHFHVFMQKTHHSLAKHQGEKNPLDAIAKEIADKAIVICFDEFFVSDITDAMLLGRLFRNLFNNGVSLITTSNTAPDELYKYGLQREQFIPAIEAIKEHTEVIHLQIAIDYRLRHLQEAGVFYTPLNEETKRNMEKAFFTLTQGKIVDSLPIDIAGRQIQVIKKSEEVIWFTFNEICTVPRSQQDYLIIAERYKTVFISDIPVIGESEKDKICLFVSLIDVFYDANVRVVISSAEPVSEIYSRGFMIKEYTRTNSRLIEMQSSDYFAGEFTQHEKK